MAAAYAAFREKNPAANLPPLPTHAELRGNLELLESLIGVPFFEADDGLTTLYQELTSVFHLYRFKSRCARTFDSDDAVGPPALLDKLVVECTEELPAVVAKKLTSAHKTIRLTRAGWFELFEIADALLAELFINDDAAAPPAARTAPAHTPPAAPPAGTPPPPKRSRPEEAEK